MSSLVIYLIKANIALTLFYLAYRFGLRRLTFYSLNRFFLLFGITFSAIFPLININTFFQQHEQLAGSVAYYSPDWTSMQQIVQQQPFTVWSIIQYVFWAGVVVMAIRLCIQLLSLLQIHLRTKSGIINNEEVKIMYDRINPFSFFKNIYINPALHSPEELENILKHEKIHAKGWHSADVLAGEINNIFYWFNPGAWLMKTAIQENLEFITDRKILNSGMDAKSYQYSLVKVSSIPFANPLANNFNFSHLKTRIKMMNRKKSSGFHLLRYLLLLPVIAIAAFIINSSRAQTVSAKKATAESSFQSDTLQVLKKVPKNEYFNEKGYVIRVKMGTGETTVLNKTGVVLGPFNVFSMSPQQLAGFNERFGSNATYEEVQAMKDRSAYLKTHPEITGYSYSSADEVLVWEGKSSKKYNLRNAYDRDALIRKYGSIPPVYGRFADGRPVPQLPQPRYTPPHIEHRPKDYVEFLKRNPSVESLAWGGKPVSNSPTFVIVHLKNGETERYHLDNKEEMKKAEAKYGKFPAPPPPPPPTTTKIKSISFNIPTNTNKKESKHLPSVILIPTSLVSPQEDTMKKDDKFYAQIAYKAAQQKHYDWAENYAHQSLKLNPNNAKAKSILRYVQQMKSYQSKMEEYDKERGNNPLPKVKVRYTPPPIIISNSDQHFTDSSQHYAYFSYQASREKNYQKATSYAQKSLQLNPNNAMAKQVLRYVNQMRGFQEKMEEYKKAHKDMDSVPSHAVNFSYPVNNHGLLSETSSGIMTLFPAPPVDRVFGSNQTLPETVIGERYYRYNVKGTTKNTRNTPLTRIIATRANYDIKDTTIFPPKNALYIVNDKKVDRAYIQKLAPQNISSIYVLKDKKAIHEYGPAAKEGVIKIYTKEYEAAHPSIYRKEMKNYEKKQASKDTSVTLSANKVVLQDKKNSAVYAKPVYLTMADSNRPVILINDKVTKDESALDEIPTNEIDSVVVMKKDIPLLIKQYGAQAKNGVVKIYTKAE